MLSSHLSHLSEHAYLITFVMQDNVCKLLNKAYICSERFWYTSMNMYICNFRPSDPFRSIFFSYGIASFSITRSCMRGRRQQPPGAKQPPRRVAAWLSVWCDGWKDEWRTYSNIVRIHTCTNPDHNFGPSDPFRSIFFPTASLPSRYACTMHLLNLVDLLVLNLVMEPSSWTDDDHGSEVYHDNRVLNLVVSGYYSCLRT